MSGIGPLDNHLKVGFIKEMGGWHALFAQNTMVVGQQMSSAQHHSRSSKNTSRNSSAKITSRAVMLTFSVALAIAAYAAQKTEHHVANPYFGGMLVVFLVVCIVHTCVVEGKFDGAGCSAAVIGYGLIIAIGFGTGISAYKNKYSSELEGKLDPFFDQIATFTVPETDSPGIDENTGSKKKRLVLDIRNHGIADSHFLLDPNMRAERPEEVEQLIWMEYGLELGEVVGKTIRSRRTIRRARPYYHVYCVNPRNSQTIKRATLFGDECQADELDGEYYPLWTAVPVDEEIAAFISSRF